MQNPPPNQQQGYGYNQYGAPPEPPVTNPQGTGPGGKTSMGLDANLAALIAYVATWLSGLIIFLIEKENRFVRFHAMQAILLGAAFAVISIGLTIFMGVLSQISGLLSLIGLLIWPVVGIGFLAAWIFCMIKAYQGQWFKLPVLGQVAENIVNK